MSNKAKRVLLIIGILAGFAVASLLLVRKESSLGNNRMSRISRSIFHAVATEKTSQVFQYVTQILNNQ